MHYWLLKSEPRVFSIDHLAHSHTALWDGIRNYQARNHLKTMQLGDLCFFYHSSNAELGIAGLCAVVETMVIDPSQFDPASADFDPKSTPENPRWHTVRVQFVEKFAQVVTLDQLQATFSGDELLVVRKGYRLSVMPVSAAAASRIITMARHESPV